MTSIIKNIFKRPKERHADSHASSDEMSIGTPTAVSHTIHIFRNPSTGSLEGVPDIWKKYVGNAIT